MSLLSVLPKSTPRYQYQAISECLDTVDREYECFEKLEKSDNPYVIFELGSRGFQEIKDSYESLLIKSVVEIDETFQIAVLKIETIMHCVPAGSFSGIFQNWTRQFPELMLLPLSTGAVYINTSSGQKLSKRADFS